MTDKELAEAVVALGIAEGPNNWYAYALIVDGPYNWKKPSKLVRDWRVAWALMEKIDAHFIEKLTETVWAARSDKPYGEGKTREWYENESLPRAIIEACMSALS